MISAAKILNSLFVGLTPRQKEIIIDRFGIDKSSESGKTLAAIGEDLNLTRERVRQIEASAAELIGNEIKKNSACLQMLNRAKKHLKGVGGAMKKDSLLEYCAGFVDGLNENRMALLMETSGSFYLHQEDDNFWPFYYLTEKDLKTVVDLVKEWVSFLEKNKGVALGGEYNKLLKNFIKTKRINKNVVENLLAVSKNICSNPYGEFGLKHWSEIKPLTTRDRAYLVLKKIGEPLHFETIAGKINEVGFVEANLALAPTVHNELIKDDRFVLVGRGMYGLKEHGYEPGIAREIIRKVLKRNGPLHTNDVLSHVNKQRFFKPNTVIINLQNKDFFERLSDGRYRVRES